MSVFSIPLFLPFKWYDVVDILLVALLLYYLYKLVRGTVAIRILIGILAIYLLWKIVEAFQMQMFSEILGQFIGVGVIALIIVFQQEIRRFLLLIGTSPVFEGRSQRIFQKIISPENTAGGYEIQPVVDACSRMSDAMTGALIVLSRKSNPSYYVDGGTLIDAKVSSALLQSIFMKTSPLHDGAVLIHNNRIDMARCVLPISNSNKITAEQGMRHRSALGITENTDAIAIVVSEENGKISVASRGELKVGLKTSELHQFLNTELQQN